MTTNEAKQYTLRRPTFPGEDMTEALINLIAIGNASNEPFNIVVLPGDYKINGGITVGGNFRTLIMPSESHAPA